MGELRDELVKRRKTPVERVETPEKSEEPDFDTLRSYLKKAAASESIEEFESLIKK